MEAWPGNPTRTTYCRPARFPHLRMKARWAGRIALTALALVIIVRWVHWRDRGRLADGTPVIVWAHRGQELEIEPLGRVGQRSAVPITAVSELESGVASLAMRASWPLLGASLGCNLLCGLLLSFRWHCLLGARHNSPRFLVCAVAWAQAQVIGVLPTSEIGGDLFRIERAARWIGSRWAAAGVVVAERLAGFAALLFVAGCGLTWGGVFPSAWLAVLAVSAIGVGLTLAQGAWRRRSRCDFKATLLTSSIGVRLDATCRPALAQMAGLVQKPARILIVLLLSITVQALASLSFTFVDRALGLDTPLWCYLVAIPVLTLARFLPLHIAGIGILEGGLAVILQSLAGRTFAEVIALSAALRMLGLLWVGALSLTFLVPDPATSPRTKPLGSSDSLLGPPPRLAEGVT